MQRITVKRFMALRDVEIDINDFLVLIGEQASGKSTLSKLIYFFKSIRQDFVDILYDELDNDPHQIRYFWARIGRKFYDYFGSTRHLEDFEIVFHYDTDKRIHLTLRDDRSLEISIEPTIFHQSLFFAADIRNYVTAVKNSSKQADAFGRKEFQRSLSELEKHTKILFNEAHSPLFIPAGRNITVNYSDQFNLRFYGNLRSDLTKRDLTPQDDTTFSATPSADLYLMENFLLHTERIKDRFKSNRIDEMISQKMAIGERIDTALVNRILNSMNKIIKGEYQHDQYGEKIYYEQGRYVYLNNASSGQQEAIRILQDAFLIVLDKEDAFRVIEEPEAHLYPTAQKHLIEVLANVINGSASQIIITTHSPYILSSVNNLLFAHRVATTNPASRSEVDKVLSESSWLDPSRTGVYFLTGGGSESIFDRSTGLVQQSKLDDISEDLGADFQDLYEIHARAFA